MDPTKDITIQQIEDILLEATHKTRKTVLDILQRRYISVEDHPEIWDDIHFDMEMY